jgi:hypothetical protein
MIGQSLGIAGAQGRIRTTDTRIFSPPPMIDFIQQLASMSRIVSRLSPATHYAIIVFGELVSLAFVVVKPKPFLMEKPLGMSRPLLNLAG